MEDSLQNLYESATAQNKPFQPGLSAIEPPCRSNNGQEGIEGGVHGGEVSQRYLHPHSDVKLAVGMRLTGSESDEFRLHRFIGPGRFRFRRTEQSMRSA